MSMLLRYLCNPILIYIQSSVPFPFNLFWNLNWNINSSPFYIPFHPPVTPKIIPQTLPRGTHSQLDIPLFDHHYYIHNIMYMYSICLHERLYTIINYWVTLVIGTTIASSLTTFHWTGNQVIRGSFLGNANFLSSRSH